MRMFNLFKPTFKPDENVEVVDSSLYDYFLKNFNKYKSWSKFFNQKDVREEIKKISDFLEKEIRDTKKLEISPTIPNIFKAFEETKFQDLKCVIIGQDPAPEPNLATGLAFSINDDVSTKYVPSIQRILIEANNNGFKTDILFGNNTKWANQGVLLINTALTIPIINKRGQIGAHLEIWEQFTSKLITYLNKLNINLTYILWGEKAHHFKKYLNNKKHYIVEGGHPTPVNPKNNFSAKIIF